MKAKQLMAVGLVVAGLVACSSNQPQVSTEQVGSYKCYADFMNIWPARVSQGKANSIRLLDTVKRIQTQRSVNFETALNAVKYFEGNQETQAIEKKIADIDTQSMVLDALVKPESGEASCIERLALEQTRAELSNQRLDAVEKALLDK